VPIKLLFQLSWRNLWRHRRRNGIMLCAIAVAVAGVVLLNSLLRGMQVDMQNTVIDNLTGHVKVLQPGYRDDPGIGRGFAVADDWQVALDPQAVVGWAERVRVPAVIMSERETRGVQLVGIDPAQEGISFLSSVDIDGERLSGPEDRRVIVGAALAEQLETEVGRRLVLVTQGADGRNREAGYRIAGIYKASVAGLEKAFVFTGAATLQDMLDTLVVTEVSVRLTDDLHGPSMIERMKGAFAELDVLSWRDLEPQAALMVDFADQAVFIYFLVVMGALVFGLVNTLVTAVMERVRELGMLRALGMKPSTVVAQVVVESSLIMTCGIVLGLGLAAGVFSLVADGIDLSAFDESMASFGLRPVFVPVLAVGDVVLVGVLSSVLGLVASFYPARRAVKLKPLDALRR
jgi:ABC-type lipoprotein release transport system permease subunit